MTMAPERLSRLQRRILVWLVAEDQRTWGTMAASHEDLVRTLMALGFDKGNVSTSLKGLEAKGLVTITGTPGGKAEAVDLTHEGRNRVVRWRQVVNRGKCSWIFIG
jgi:DNA-binding MarR family transcriptional regulator